MRVARASPAAAGLSPRVRGYLDPCGPHQGARGSIPAGAGLPTRRTSWKTSTRGLSPRVRGYHDEPGRRGHPYRSIPAGAGLPSTPGAAPTSTRVYPRGCGATPATVCQDQGATGPSLRVSRRKRASLSQEDQCVAGYSAAYRVRSIGGIRGNRNVKEQTPPVTQSLPGTSSAAWDRLRRSPAPPPLPAPGAPLRHGPP